MFGKKHSEQTKLLISDIKRQKYKLNPKPKKIKIVMSKDQLSKYRHTYMKALWNDESTKYKKLEGIRRGNIKRRLFGDDVVEMLRQEYLKYGSFTEVAKLHEDITYDQVRNLIKFGTTHNLPNSSSINWLKQ